MDNKMQATGFIEDLTTTEKTLSIASFLTVFGFNRFFKNNDEMKKRLRLVESSVSSIQTSINHLDVSRKEDSVKLEKIDVKLHKAINILNNKMLKDSIVDSIHKEMVTIKNLLEKQK